MRRSPAVNAKYFLAYTLQIWSARGVMASRLFKKGKGAAAAGKTKDILSDADFRSELVAAGDRLVVVNFSAVWYIRA